MRLPCIDILYSNAGCWVIKVMALEKLGHMHEARSVLVKAERITEFMLTNAERAIKYAPTDSELDVARFKKLVSVQYRASLMHKRLFKQ